MTWILQYIRGDQKNFTHTIGEITKNLQNFKNFQRPPGKKWHFPNLSRVWFFLKFKRIRIQRCLKLSTIENWKYDIVQVFNKYQWLTILIHCNFVSSCLTLEIFVRNKTTYEVDSNKHNIGNSSYADVGSYPTKWLTVGNFHVTPIVNHYNLLQISFYKYNHQNLNTIVNYPVSRNDSIKKRKYTHQNK